MMEKTFNFRFVCRQSIKKTRFWMVKSTDVNTTIVSFRPVGFVLNADGMSDWLQLRSSPLTNFYCMK